MNSYINYIFTRIAVLTAVMLAMMLPMSCNDDFGDDHLGPNEEGLYGPFSFTVGFSSPAGEERSRSTFATTNLEINEAWVAMFDVESGRLVGMSDKKFSNTSAPNGSHNNTVGSDYDMQFNSLFFNDDQNKVFIVGVVNYADVKAYPRTKGLKELADADGFIDLKTALDSVKTVEDFRRIAVNTASAEKAVQDKNAPLMSGIFSPNGSHSNYTIDADGKPSNSAVSVFELFDSTTKKLKTGISGLIHLRRLVDHINVTVNLGNGLTIANPTVQVYNIPQSVFLQEHTTVQNASAYTAEDWHEIYTTAASDVFGGYIDMPVFGIQKDPVIDFENAGFFQDEADILKISGSTIKFGYWHYENKHWGLPACTDMKKREERYGESDVYKSLCPSESADFNNGATYFVLRGRVTDTKNGISADAEFYIHEGYCCDAEGAQATTTAVASRDFATFRNTNYTYTITINGINDMVLNVTSGGLDGNPGVSGSVWCRTIEEETPQPGKEYNITIPADEGLIWCIEQDGNIFGRTIDESSRYYSQWSKLGDISSDIPEGHTFYNGIKFNVDGIDYSLADEIPASAANNGIISGTLKMAEHKKSEASLYLCTISKSEDGRTSLYSVYHLTQYGFELVAPNEVIVVGADSPQFIVGLVSNEIKWTPVEGITKYRITIDGTNFSKDVTAADWTDKGDGYLTYRMPYTNGLMALNNGSSYTFSVASIDGKRVSEKRSSKSVKITLPVWNFSASEWKNAAKAQPIVSGTGNFTGDVDFTVNGLRLLVKDNDKVKYDNTGNYYYFLTGGAGSKTKRVFMFRSKAKGKIIVHTTSSGGTPYDGRHIKVETNDGTVLTSGEAGDIKMGNNQRTNILSPVNPTNTETIGDNEYNVYIYADSNLAIYYIEFIPED